MKEFVISLIIIGLLFYGIMYVAGQLLTDDIPETDGNSVHGGKEAPALIEATFEDLLDAIEWVESKGDANVVGDSGRAIGAFQIHKIYVDDLNRINRLTHTDKYSSPIDFEYSHRKSRSLSRAMVRDYLRYYATRERIGRNPAFEDMARIHNGGPQGHKKESTKKYWEKVKARMEK